MKKLTLILCSAALLAPLTLSAQGNFTGWNAGAYAFHISGLDGWGDDVGFGARAGYLFTPAGSPNWRHGPQVDLSYASLDTKFRGVDVDLDLTTLMASYIIGNEIAPRWFLFGGAGAGVTWAKVSASRFGSEDETAASWQLFVGVEWAVTQNVGLRGGYRHFWVDDGDFSDDASLVEAGVTFWF